MAPKQKQEPGRGIWIGNGKGGTHPADAARTPQPPLTPHQQAGPSIPAPWSSVHPDVPDEGQAR